MGFSSNLLCSSCDLLGQFSLGQLDLPCRQCCQEEAQLESRKVSSASVSNHKVIFFHWTWSAVSIMKLSCSSTHQTMKKKLAQIFRYKPEATVLIILCHITWLKLSNYNNRYIYLLVLSIWKSICSQINVQLSFFFFLWQLYPGAILEVCGWKLGRFPQVQGRLRTLV